MRLRLASAALLLCVSAVAHADSVTFTLSNAVQGVSAAGGTLSFNATVTAPSSNTGSEDLNSIYVQFSSGGTSNFFVDPSSFFNTFPLSLNAGESYTGLLFTVMVPSNTAAGSYLGTVELDGGPNGTALGTQGFTINVAPAAVAATPEPSSLLMLGTGALALAGSFRRRFTGC